MGANKIGYLPTWQLVLPVFYRIEPQKILVKTGLSVLIQTVAIIAPTLTNVTRTVILVRQTKIVKTHLVITRIVFEQEFFIDLDSSRYSLKTLKTKSVYRKAKFSLRLCRMKAPFHFLPWIKMGVSATFRVKSFQRLRFDYYSLII